MGQVRQIGEEYYIEFSARGLLYQQKAGKDLSKAEELLRQTEEKIVKGELQTISREIDLDIFFAEFFKYASSRYHPHSVRRLSLTIQHFSKFLQESFSSVTKLSQITPRVVEEYKAFYTKPESKTFNERKINLTILLLREILEYGIKTGYINDNPTLHLRLLNVKARRNLTISTEEWEGLMKSVDQQHKPILVLMRQTGLRPHEALGLIWEKVDLNRNVIFVRSREIPLTPQARGLLNEMFVNVIDYKAKVFHVGYLPNKTPLAMLRHSFACDLLQKNISFLMVGKIFGVHDIAKLMIYAHSIPIQREDIFS